ncbi:MAG: TolC family protein [Candidatus Marinimicrobia bacterium]|nr:TolC family protein [Candidatus Neomarinimicrobiota bacterium]
MKKIIIFILIISGILAAETLDFETAVNIALENNLSIKMAENGLQMTRNLVNPGVLLPGLSLNGNSNYSNTDAFSQQDYERHVNSASLSTSYTLFSGFYVLNSYKKLKLQHSQSELETRYTIETIIAAMAQTYYSLANAQEQLQLARENLQLSGERLKRTQEQEKVGRINKVAMLAAEVDYIRDSISVETARLNYENSLRNLNVMLNRKVDAAYDIDKEVTLLTLPEYEELKSSAFEKNADYLAMQYGIDLARLDLKLAQSGYFPTLNLSGSYGLSQTNSEFDPGISDADKIWNVGLSLNFSLFNGFQRKVKQQNAKISLDNQRLALEQTKLNLDKQIASQYTTYVNSKKTLEMEKLSLSASEANFERSRELYELGQVTSTQFREAQLNLMRAKSNISAGKYNVKLNEIALLQSAGLLLD